MKITVSQLRRIIREEIKKVNEVTESDIKTGFKFTEMDEGYTMSGRGTITTIWEVVKDLGNDKYECKVDYTTSSGSPRVGTKSIFTKQQIIRITKHWE